MTRAIHTRPGARPGVTLIEILVVIAIIGILLALTSAALQKTAEGQNVKSSKDQVFKLQQALDLEYERVVQKCATDATNGAIPQEVLNYCEGNPARAKAVWTAYQLRLHFPNTFKEAAVAPQLADGTTVYYQAQPKATFNDVAPVVAGSGTFVSPPYEAQDESAALLFLILARQSVSGGGAMATSAEDLTQAMRTKVTFTAGNNSKELEVFADAWKNSIGFQRWANDPELQNPPYVDAKLAAQRNQNPNSPPNLDPLDPQSLVFGWADAGKKKSLQQQGLFFLNGLNRTPLVYSVGKNKVLDAALPNDDILGFRLRQQGNKGTKP